MIKFQLNLFCRRIYVFDGFIFEKEKWSARKLTAILKHMPGLMEKPGSSSQITLFKRNRPIRAEILEAALRRIERDEAIPYLFEDQAGNGG